MSRWFLWVVFFVAGYLVSVPMQDSFNRSNPLVAGYPVFVNDIEELQKEVYDFCLDHGVGSVEYLGSFGKDSDDRRSVGFGQSGAWRVVTKGPESGEAIRHSDVVMTIVLSDEGNSAFFEASSGNQIPLLLTGNPRIIEKLRQELKIVTRDPAN